MHMQAERESRMATALFTVAIIIGVAHDGRRLRSRQSLGGRVARSHPTNAESRPS